MVILDFIKWVLFNCVIKKVYDNSSNNFQKNISWNYSHPKNWKNQYLLESTKEIFSLYFKKLPKNSPINFGRKPEQNRETKQSIPNFKLNHTSKPFTVHRIRKFQSFPLQRISEPSPQHIYRTILKIGNRAEYTFQISDYTAQRRLFPFKEFERGWTNVRAKFIRQQGVHGDGAR